MQAVLSADFRGKDANDRDDQNHGERADPGTGLENASDDFAAWQKDHYESQKQQLKPSHSVPSVAG